MFFCFYWIDWIGFSVPNFSVSCFIQNSEFSGFFEVAKDTFDEGGIGSDLPEIKIDSNDIKKGLSILDFIANNKILNSKSEARRAIANRGLKIDGVIIDDEKKILKLKDFKKNIFKLSYGKKKHYLVKII